jgi:hypothetical protein
MAKRVAKYETNAQRAAREDEFRTTQLVAGAVAHIICNKGNLPAEIEPVIQRIKRSKGVVMGPEEIDPQATKPESKRLKETYALVGREFCDCKGNVSEFLRLVADLIEAKPLHSPGQNWYDAEITRAYKNACRTVPFTKHWDLVLAGILVPPTFTEFIEIFREQNPKLHGASDRSLRRSLRRLGYGTRPAERGRPRTR